MAKHIAPEEVPQEYRYLYPEQDEEIIVIGQKAYKLLPLPHGMLQRFWMEVADVVAAVTKAFALKKGKKVDPIVLALNAIREAITDMLKSGRIAKILSVCIDEPEEKILEEMTVKQGIHLVGVLYRQNLDMSDMPEAIRKNLDGLLMLLGLKRPSDQTGPMAMMMLSVLEDVKAGAMNEENAIERLNQIASTSGFLSDSKSTESTSPSPVNTDGEESTSTDEEKEFVPLQEKRVGEAMTTFATKQGATKKASSPKVNTASGD